MAYPVDFDLRQMTPAALRQEVMRLRHKIRWHRDLEENARCWHCDVELYAVLPEERPAGKMQGEPAGLFRNCVRYICRQQCTTFGCRGSATDRRRLAHIIQSVLMQISRLARGWM